MSYIINFSILKRNQNFCFLYIGQFISFLGTMITGVALPYQVYHLTQSTLMVGLVSLFQLIPLLFTALLGGVLADRFHRKKLLIIAEFSLGLGCLVLMFNAYLTHPHLWLIFITAAFMSGMNGLHRPALESMTQQVVSKDDLPRVSALSSFKFNLSSIAGPAIGGLMIAHFGLVITFLLDFISFLISLIALYLIKNIPYFPVSNEQSAFSSLVQGVRYALSRQELLGSYCVDFMAMVFGMPLALFPAIAQSYGDVRTLGMLYSAPAVGALVCSFFSGWTTHIKRHGVAIAIAATLWGVAIICFGYTRHHLWIALFFLALAGAFDDISGIFRQTLWNETIPTQYRGRLAGIEMISYMSGPKLGDTEAGIVAAAFGVTASIVSGGALCVIGVAACCYFLPRFWKYQRQSYRG
jgi:MFS family permease